MADGRTVVIAGAGIGGLTAAVALSANGLSPIIVERAERLSEVGAGIQLAPNAGRILAGLGLDQEIARAAIAPLAIDVFDGRSGRRLTSVAGTALRDRYGFPYRVIHRADLQAVLATAAARAGVVIQFRASVTEVDQSGSQLRVNIRAPDGDRAVSAAALVGADGVWSATRQRIPGAAQPSPTGRTAWRAMVPYPAVGHLVAADRVGLWLGPRAHLVHYPVARGAMVNLVAIVEEPWTAEGWSAPAAAADLAAQFAGWSTAVGSLLAAASTWQKFTVLALDPIAAWQAHRIVLLGDAAHAMPPYVAQGAAMAIEDAAVLARAIASGTDISEALRGYVGERQSRVAAVATASARTGNVFHWRGLTATARNLALRLAGQALVLRRSDPIYRWKP